MTPAISENMTADTIRIGCASGFWGDSSDAARQLAETGDLDYLVFDYLAEITMSLLSRARAKNPQAGFVPDFVEGVIRPLADTIARKKIKVIANAGGVNPAGCKAAIEAVLAKAGVKLKVAAVLGDDVLPLAGSLRGEGITEMFTGAPLPEHFWSMNAYLGAPAIRDALAAGADIVVTGRAVDSAVTLGALMHAFGWAADDWDRLAAGSLAGHILECGAQATGGLFTDWREVADGWDDMGFPIAECSADGAITVTKPPKTGGLVSPATVAEQLVYEVGDPAAYLLPDVVCDFSQVRLVQTGPDRVAVTGARGRPAPDSYKVSATWHDGFRVTGTLMIGGREAAEKARRVGEAILARSARLLTRRNLGPFTETSIEVLGAEETYGPHARAQETREVVLKIAARHPDKDALEILAREIAPSGTAMAQGITGFAAGRPRVQPLIRLFSFLIAKARVPIEVEIGTDRRAVDIPPVAAPQTPPPLAEGPSDIYTHGVTVPLIALAHGRSGDKGDKANIGIIARDPVFVPLLRGTLTAAAVKTYMAHLVEGEVERFDWPGLNGFNFLLHDALGGGGTASLRYDPQGKAYAQMLLDMPVTVPADWVGAGGPLAGWRDAG
jgi:hypothetical protein